MKTFPEENDVVFGTGVPTLLVSPRAPLPSRSFLSINCDLQHQYRGPTACTVPSLLVLCLPGHSLVFTIIPADQLFFLTTQITVVAQQQAIFRRNSAPVTKLNSESTGGEVNPKVKFVLMECWMRGNDDSIRHVTFAS